MNICSQNTGLNTVLHTPKDRYSFVEAPFPTCDDTHYVLIEARAEFLSDKQVKSALCGTLFSSYLT